MTIKFTTTDGRTVETTEKNVLFEAAKNGEITPETMVDIDGRIGVAGQIKGMEFGAPKATTAPASPEPQKNVLPEKIAHALEMLRGVAFVVAGLGCLAGITIIVNNLGGDERYVPYVGDVKTPANPVGIGVGVGVMLGAVINAYASNLLLDVFEYIAKAVTKKDDK